MMNSNIDNQNISSSQSGLVAIFTVIFFVILTSVLTMSYLRIMLNESRQALDNDLTASALHAAEAGVEDGKRLLLYCASQPDDNPDCTNGLSQTQCPGIFSGNNLATTLGINTAIEADGSVRISNNAGTEEHYTCLLVNSTTPDYQGTLPANSSDVIPLKVTNPYSVIELSWHQTTDTAQGPVIAYPDSGKFADATQWASQQYPAAMRLQLFNHEVNNILLDNLDSNSRAVFLQPVSNTESGASNDFDLLSRDVRPGPKNQPLNVRCIPVGSLASRYACTARIAIGSVIDPSRLAYLRVASIYGSTDFQVRLLNASNDIVQFDGVQPLIDSTGRSNDVFRRVQTRVRMDSNAFYPQFALESGKDLCKDMVVTNSASSFEDNCSFTSPPECTGVASTNTNDITVVGGDKVLITLADPLEAGCKYLFTYGWGDFHPAQQAACEGGPGSPGWYPGVCDVWRQPYESMFMDFMASADGPVVQFRDGSGAMVSRTPDTGDLPDRFPLPDPDVYLDPLGIRGAEAKRMRVVIDLTNASNDVTHMNLMHSIQPPRTGFGGSSHLYDFTFTPIP